MSTGDKALLTVSQLEQAEKNTELLKEEIRAMEVRLSEEEEIVAFGRKLLKRASTAIPPQAVITSHNRVASTTTRKRRTKKPTWTSEILRCVEEVGFVSYPDLKQVLLDGPLGRRLQASDKGFYGGMAKLEEQKLLVRHKDHAFTHAEYERYQERVAAGGQEIMSASSSRGSPMTGAICEFLQGNPRGATSAEVANHLKSIPEISDGMNKGSATFYNNLARLVKREVLTKDLDSKVYRLVINANKKDPAEAESLENVGVGTGDQSGASYPTAEGSIPSTSTQISRALFELQPEERPNSTSNTPTSEKGDWYEPNR